MRKRKIDTTGKPWARYLRLSKAEAISDRSKTKDERLALTQAKLDDHLAELTRWMDAHDVPYSDDHVYRDPALSAWKPGVKRPQWDAMMEAAEAGQLAGIGIVAVDRFTRDVTTMEDLIKLAETTDIKIGGPRAGRLDLTTYDGIQQARGMAVQAANESLATSFRLKEHLGRRMRNGQPMGAAAPFGFKHDGWEQEPADAAIVREIAERMINGEPLSRIATDLNDRKVATSRGAEWTSSKLSRMLKYPRYGGYVEHHGKIVAKIRNRDGSEQEPILDADTYSEVQAVLMSRRRGRPVTDVYMLTGILRCDRCDLAMNGARHARARSGESERKRVYRCPPNLGGCSRTISADGVEEMVSERMIELLSDPELSQAVATELAALSEARSEQQTHLDRVDQQIVDLEVKWAAGQTTQAAYDQAQPVLMRRREELAAALAELAPDMTGGSGAYDAAADWAAMTIEQQRHAIRRYRLNLKIGPHNGARWFDPERVAIKIGS